MPTRWSDRFWMAGRLALALVSMISCPTLSAHLAPPGIELINQARAQFLDPATGSPVTITSEPVRATLEHSSTSVLEFHVTASNRAPEVDSEVTLGLHIRNLSAARAVGIAITLDGVTRSLFLARAIVPANTTFTSVANGSDAVALYHEFGAPLHTYTTTPPADRSRVDAVAFAFVAFPLDVPLSFAFKVHVNANASGPASVEAQLCFDDGIRPGETIADSDSFSLNIRLTSPSIGFHTDASFSTLTRSAPLNGPLFLQASAAQCNRDPTRVDTGFITLTSIATGDLEVFLAEETGPNTGWFRTVQKITTVDARQMAVVQRYGVIQSARNDHLRASFDGCGSGIAESTVLVDPDGILFDSRTDAPIPGGSVTLIDATSGNPAMVFQADGVTPAPSTVVTDAEGHYKFPTVVPGLYRLAVVAPPGFQVPSKLRPDELPKDRVIDPSGSYLGNFRITQPVGSVRIDVPADPLPPGLGGGFFVQKEASRKEAEIGDLITYVLRIRNTSGRVIEGATLRDDLPAGFGFLKGSARLDNRPQPDPAPQPKARLEFALGSIPDKATLTLVYHVRVGPGAGAGDGANRAQAVAPGVESNVAVAVVKLIGGVFTDRSVIIGKIFVDTNQNRIQDPGELGIPGVRFYLEDGSFAISDSEGKYSFYGLSPRTHVLKVDATTLPVGSVMEALGAANAGTGQTRFVDLKAGELHKANFAEASSTPAILKQVRDRRAKGEVFVAEIEKAIKDRLTPDGVSLLVGDTKALPASGMIGGLAAPETKSFSPSDSRGTNAVTRVTSLPAPPLPSTSTNVPAASPSFDGLLPSDTLNSAHSALPPSQLPSGPRIPMEAALQGLDATLDFLDLREGDTLPAAQLTVRVKGPLASVFKLRVNEAVVPASQVGRKSAFAARSLEAWEFIGVNLRPGTNVLDLIQTDSFGNARGKKSIRVVAPDKLARIQIVLPTKQPLADGVTPTRIRVLLRDAHGVPVTARTPITLETSAGRWSVDDLDKREPGVQVFIEGGAAEFGLLPPQEPADASLVVSSGAMVSKATLAFLPDLRPMLAVGVVEGAINLSQLNRAALLPARSKDGFDEELREFATSGSDGKLHAGGRAAVFLKGKIKGDFLLTAGYDSEKAAKERLFRDIQPDEFYPVYGDSSIRGYDAQSTGRLYVRIDKNKCYLLYGDFNTHATSEARGLGNYSRSLTGIREHYETHRLALNAWASQDGTRQVIEELPANGTSGPYYFNARDGVVNSEQVEILTRDRNQPSQILKTLPAARFIDYELEPFTGRILFKAPVASLDSNLNPISIRVTFEVDQNGDKFWVYGADGQMKLGSHLEIGGAAVRDENPMGHYGLYSANSTLKLGPQTYAIAEVAESDSEIGGVGRAGRVEVRHKGEGTDARVYLGRTEASFTNNASVLLPGRIEGGMKVTQRLNDKTRLITQGLWTEDVTSHGSRRGVRVDVERAFGTTRMELGVRHSEETAAPASPSTFGLTPNEVNSVRTKVTTPVPHLKDASIYGEYENDVVDTQNRMVALGLDYQLKHRGKLYARHEFISSLGGPFELNSGQQHNTTVVGLETEYMKDGHAFNEYRARDAFTGREAEAATGLRNLWDVADGLRLHTTFERITPFNSGNQNESTAVTGAIEYTRDPNWKGTARLELRSSTPNDSLLSTFGYARKVSRDWTALSKAILLMVDNKAPGVGDKNQARLQAGMAYRQTDTDRWNGLLKYEFKFEEDGSTPAALLRRKVNMLSLDLNYQPGADWVLNAHYSGKLAVDDLLGADHWYLAHLLGARVAFELTRRWDIGANANVLLSGDGRQRQYALGPEIGFRVRTNLRLGVGFNVVGFRDVDLASDGFTNPGVFLNLRLKFDETLFSKADTKEK